MSTENCAEFNSELSRWLESSWENRNLSVPEEFLEHARQCSECHRELALVRRLRGIEFNAPDGLTDSVMSSISNEIRPQFRRRIPAVAAAALLVLALGLGLFVGTGRQTTVTVELTLNAPEASSVAVVGGWNGWDSSADLMTDSDGDGIWQIELRLKPESEYLYQFVIDQNTRTADPLALLNMEDGFGGVNSVLRL